MTRNRRIQAVLLAAIMAISVVGMSVAFAGSAAAAGGDGSATDQDLGSTVIQDSTTQIAQEVDVSSSAGTLDIDMIEINNSAGTAPDSAISSIAVYEDDGNGQFDGDGNEQNKLGSTANPNLGDSGAVIGSDDDNTISSVAGGETNKYLIVVTTSSPQNFQDGETIQLGTNFTETSGSTTTFTSPDVGDEVATSAVTTNTPTFANPDPQGSTVSSDTKKFTIDVNDDQKLVDGSTLEVDIEGPNHNNQNDLTDSVSGISYDSDNDQIVVDPSKSGVNPYADGTITVNASISNGATAKNYTRDNGADGISFTVDTVGPSINFQNPTNGESLTSGGLLTVDVSDSTLTKAGSVEATLNGQKLNDISGADVNNGAQFNDGFEYHQGNNTLAIRPGKDVMPTLDSGSNTLKVAANDTFDNRNTSQISFTLDDTKPEVNKVTVSQAPINSTNQQNKQLVTVEFSEAMNTNNPPEIGIDQGANNSDPSTIEKNNVANIKDGVSNNGFGIDDGFDSASQTWTGTIPAGTFATNQNITSRIVVSGVTDEAGNNLTQGSAPNTYDDDTIYVDTNNPSATVASPTSDSSGTIDVTSKLFTVDTNGESSEQLSQEQYFYRADSNAAWQEITSTANFDTTALSDGLYDFAANATDDVGNTDTAIINGHEIDNNDPKIQATSANDTLVSGNVNISNHFSAQIGDTEGLNVRIDDTNDGTYDNGSITQLPNDGDPAKLTDLGDITTSGFTDETPFRVEVEGYNDSDGSSANDSATLRFIPDNPDGLGITNTSQADGSQKITLVPEAGAQLDTTTVYLNMSEVATADSGGNSVVLDENDFTEFQDRFGDYSYEATVSGVQDGRYDLTVESFTDNAGRTQTQVQGGNVDIDETRPGLVDAYVTDANSTHMNATVTFNETVKRFAASKLTVEGADVVSVQIGHKGDSDANVTINSNIQTGDAPNIQVDGTIEEYTGDRTGANGNDATGLASFQTQLKTGLNTFSIPAESGGFDATVLDSQVDGFDSIWTYDATAGKWSNWDPDAPTDDASNAPTLEGGQGYLVNMSSQTTAQFNVNTQPGLDNPFPNQQTLNPGWNLVGHWQEGGQDDRGGSGGTNASNALANIGGGNGIYDAGQQYQQTSFGVDNIGYSALANDDDNKAEFVPGEATWVRIKGNNDVLYSPEPLGTKDTNNMVSGPNK